MVINIIHFLYPSISLQQAFAIVLQQALYSSTATGSAVVLQPLCSNAAAPMQYPISYEL